MPASLIKKIAVILNSISPNKNFAHNVVQKLSNDFDVQLFATRSPDDAVTLAHCARAKKFDAIIAAGGDGTLHQVVNGLLQEDDHEENLPYLGMLPLGSGNDFARTLGISSNYNELIKRLKTPSAQKIDVGKIEFHGKWQTGEILCKRSIRGIRP